MSAAETPVNVWRDVREKGSGLGLFFTATVYRLFGRWIAEPITLVAAGYFLLKDSRMRGYSRSYLRKVRGKDGKEPTWQDLYRHYFSFAQMMLDRFDVWTGSLNKYTFHYHGEEHLLRQLKSGKGAVLLGAHLGNFDMLRALGKRAGAKIHILMDRRNSQMFSNVLRRFGRHMDEGVVEYDPHSVDNIFELQKAVERGEFVALLGDRVAAESTRGAKRASPALFLGETALFPQAPYLFASHLQCQVFLIFGIRRSSYEYDFFVEPFADRIELPENTRGAALDGYAAAYAARLEYHCRRAPLQWFNFYDFWGKPS